jgi:RHS repeat-associated protein
VRGCSESAVWSCADRQYWKQISNYTSGGTATTLYIGGLLEKVTTASGTDYRHMIRAGGSTIIVSRQSSGTNSINYVTSDHLGSSSAITNSSGGILVNSSFDAFGKRRGSNWTGNPSAGDWTAIASTTRRGFTEHTMLDNLNLTHMNGRVYDQILGRFASADPFITEPINTQNYNRYSYVYNNPLSAIDPSGFASSLIRPSETNWGPGYVGTNPNWTDFTPGITVSSSTFPSGGEVPEGGPGPTPIPDPSIPADTEILGWLACPRPDLAPKPVTPVGIASADIASSLVISAGQLAIPGYASGLEADAYYRNGQWGWGTAYSGLSLAEMWLAVGTLGISNQAMMPYRTARYGVSRSAGSIRNVNPTRSATNCVNCAIATDATLAGRPASALQAGPTSIGVLEKMFGGQFTRVTGPRAIESQLLNAGPGARGIVFGSRGAGEVGHVFNAVNQNGVIRFLDGQAGGVASFDGYRELFFLRTF